MNKILYKTQALQRVIMEKIRRKRQIIITVIIIKCINYNIIKIVSWNLQVFRAIRIKFSFDIILK